MLSRYFFNAYHKFCFGILMATAAYPSSSVTVPHSAVLLSSDSCIDSPTIPFTAVKAQTGDTPWQDPDEDETCPLSSLDVDELIKDEQPIPKKRKKHIDNKGTKKKKREKVTPNTFVALPVKSALLRGQVNSLHQHMLQIDPNVKRILNRIERLHMTLMVMRLNNQDEIDRAKEALRIASNSICEIMKHQPVVLNFTTLSTFGNKVLYVDVDDSNKLTLKAIAGAVQEAFESRGVLSTEKKRFNPHMTVAKLSKDRGRLRMRQISEELYEDWNEGFSHETVEEIELLSMTQSDDSGYYYCYGREFIISSQNDSL